MKKIFLSVLCFLPLACGAQAFEDVTEDHPNHKAIQWFFSNDLIEGYQEKQGRVFRPEDDISRAAALKMVLLVSGLPLVSELSQNPFEDVFVNDWFAPFVQTAVEMKVVQGFPDGHFYPSSAVTYAELLAMATRLFNAPIDDSPEGSWQTPLMDFAEKFKIIQQGVEGNDLLTRGEVAEILYRIRKVAEGGFAQMFHVSGKALVASYQSSVLGRKTSSGELLDSSSITAAHRYFPLETRVRLWNGTRVIVVRINDRISEDSAAEYVLSPKAFSLLADKGIEELEIHFEVFSFPDETSSSIPEYVRPALSQERQEQPPLPAAVAEKVSELRGDEILLPSVQPVFTETVTMLPTNFFKDFEMRKPFPLKMLAGTVFLFSGTANEYGHKEITVFLQPLTEDGDKIGEQVAFTGPVSGKNFAVPVIFDTGGHFLVGALLDDDNTSRAEIVEVIKTYRYPVLATSSRFLETSFDMRILPEEQTVVFDLPLLGQTDLLKLTFTQRPLQKDLFLSAGITELSLPYDWFKGFHLEDVLAIDLYAAESQDGSVTKRVSGWTQLGYHNYELLPGFFDTETEHVSIHNFPRWNRSLKSIHISGQVMSAKKTLRPEAFVITPSNNVITIPLFRDGDRFSFTLSPQEWGRYAVEILADDGEVLFNRALYCTEALILPVLQPEITELPSNTVAGVRAWINRVRGAEGVSSVLSSAELNTFAQSYADRMAKEQFLSHVSPTGQTFASRISAANVQGEEFAENLGQGSTLQMALNGLQASGSHFKNIIAKKWNRVGVGVTQDRNSWYVVQVFGR